MLKECLIKVALFCLAQWDWAEREWCSLSSWLWKVETGWGQISFCSFVTFQEVELYLSVPSPRGRLSIVSQFPGLGMEPRQPFWEKSKQKPRPGQPTNKGLQGGFTLWANVKLLWIVLPGKQVHTCLFVSLPPTLLCIHLRMQLRRSLRRHPVFQIPARLSSLPEVLKQQAAPSWQGPVRLFLIPVTQTSDSWDPFSLWAHPRQGQRLGQGRAWMAELRSPSGQLTKGCLLSEGPPLRTPGRLGQLFWPWPGAGA